VAKISLIDYGSGKRTGKQGMITDRSDPDGISQHIFCILYGRKSEGSDDVIGSEKYLSHGDATGRQN
jgi:hypothetical protein